VCTYVILKKLNKHTYLDAEMADEPLDELVEPALSVKHLFETNAFSACLHIRAG
jgi:hypothetical protein